MASLFFQEFVSLVASLELKRVQVCAELEAPVGFVILLRVPERAVIDRIDCHAAVISPSILAILLHSSARDHHEW